MTWDFVLSWLIHIPKSTVNKVWLRTVIVSHIITKWKAWTFYFVNLNYLEWWQEINSFFVFHIRKFWSKKVSILRREVFIIHDEFSFIFLLRIFFQARHCSSILSKVFRHSFWSPRSELMFTITRSSVLSNIKTRISIST